MSRLKECDRKLGVATGSLGATPKAEKENQAEKTKDVYRKCAQNAFVRNRRDSIISRMSETKGTKCRGVVQKDGK